MSITRTHIHRYTKEKREQNKQYSEKIYKNLWSMSITQKKVIFSMRVNLVKFT